MNDLFYDPFDPLNPIFENHTLGNPNGPIDWLAGL